LKAVFADRPVDRICPNFGCVIEGRDAVERTVEQTLRALESMAKIPRQSALAGWDYQVASR
jgi:hypothetical protein